MATKRDRLKVDELYKEQKSGMFFYTPDGIGVIWFDTLEEARDQTGIEGKVWTVTELEDF